MSTTFVFERATKEKALLRAALYGVAGAGKTMTALRIAKGMVESPFAPSGARIALIDTEFRSASKYSDRFDFDTLNLTSPTVENAVLALEAASQAGYFVVIFDSITHVWHELLMEMDRLARAKYRGNTHSAWSEGTPKQKLFSRAINISRGHVIATMRERTLWEIEERDGKKVPVRVGVGPEQGKGLEYEFDFLMSINSDHIGVVQKDRTGKFQDLIIERPDESFGGELLAWLNDGVEPAKRQDDEIRIEADSVEVRPKARTQEVRQSGEVEPHTTTKRLTVVSCKRIDDGEGGEAWEFILTDGRTEKAYTTKLPEVGNAALAAAESGELQSVTFTKLKGAPSFVSKIEGAAL